jgi:hypothetical protein
MNRLFLPFAHHRRWQRFHARTYIASPEVPGLIPEPTVPVATPAPAPEPTITAPEPAPPVPVPAEEPAPPAVVPATHKAVKCLLPIAVQYQMYPSSILESLAREAEDHTISMSRAPRHSRCSGTRRRVDGSRIQWSCPQRRRRWYSLLLTPRTRPPVQCAMKIPLQTCGTCRTPARSHCREGKT